MLAIDALEGVERMKGSGGRRRIVPEFAQMWPRDVFDIKEDGRLVFRWRKELKEPGVYILYRDDHPYYVGKTSRSLFERIWNHANMPGDKYYLFWNFFSAFVVPNKRHRDEIEGILIAAMPTANSANPKIKKIPLDRKVALRLRRMRQVRVNL